VELDYSCPFVLWISKSQVLSSSISCPSVLCGLLGGLTGGLSGLISPSFSDLMIVGDGEWNISNKRNIEFEME
jgi:hypothetical protein